MDTTSSLAPWLFGLFGAIGALGWALARYKRRRDLRRTQARHLLAALQRYSQWVCAQRLAAVFRGEPAETAAALEAACRIRTACFPELSGDMAELLAVHQRIIGFLANQQALWLQDPGHWLASDHDRRFMALWRQHRLAVEALQARLEGVASATLRPVAPRRESTYA